MNNKWQMNRAGLFNFWYYQDETYDFADGRLLLRGTNGSGKSVTMQSLIPVVLDGNKAPHRLDPFGSKARRMEDYLLGEKEISNYEERTGYLYLEFKRAHTDQYMTIGMGLKAKRGSSDVGFWGWVLRDKRVGIDFPLYKEEKQNGEQMRIPFSRMELTNRIGDLGTVVTSQRAYKELVNKHIFGFEQIEQYDDLIKLLIQLRSPKLSKEFKPTAIYDILQQALPPLADDDLRQLTDTIESMDAQKAELEQKKREFEALNGLAVVYDRVNDWYFVQQAGQFVKVKEAFTQLQTTISENETELQQTRAHVEQLRAEMETLETRRTSAEDQYEHLRQSDVFDQAKQLDDKKQDATQMEEKLAVLKRKTEEKQDQERAHILYIREKSDECALRESERTDTLDELAALAHDGYFIHHDHNAQQFLKIGTDKTALYHHWQSEQRAHRNVLADADRLWQDLAREQDALRAKERELAEKAEQLDAARDERSKWLRTEEEERESLIDAVFQWNAETELLEETHLRTFVANMNGLYDAHSFEEAKSPVYDARSAHLMREQTRLAGVQHEISRAEQDIETCDAEIALWSNKKDPEPVRRAETIAAREALVGRGEVFVPFYAALEWASDVDEPTQNRIETALARAGLLDALVMNELRDVQNDSVLTPNPQLFAHTLADYLQVDTALTHGVRFEVVQDVLQSILVRADEQTTDTWIAPDGTYGIGILQGHAAGESLGFIGREARQRKRAQIIEELQAKRANFVVRFQTLQSEKEDIERYMRTLSDAFLRFPKDTDLYTSWFEGERSKQQVIGLEVDYNRIMSEGNSIAQRFQSVKKALSELDEQYQLPSSQEGVQEAIGCMDEYRELFATLRHVDHTIQGLQANLQLKSEQLEDVEAALNELRYEITALGQRLNATLQTIAQLQQVLQSADFEGIQQKLRDVRAEIAYTKERELVIVREETNCVNNTEQLQLRLTRDRAYFTFLETLTAQYERFYRSEYFDMHETPL
ncbi:MAG: TIGR02680 family protein, partial [Bacilli bacterium]